MSDRNPYFLPLKKEYFYKLKDGMQRCEIRPNDHRGWNVKNIYPGRVLNLSCGYGKQNRILKTVFRTIMTCNLHCEDISQEHIEAVEAIYGPRDYWLVAYI